MFPYILSRFVIYSSKYLWGKYIFGAYKNGNEKDIDGAVLW